MASLIFSDVLEIWCAVRCIFASISVCNEPNSRTSCSWRASSSARKRSNAISIVLVAFSTDERKSSSFLSISRFSASQREIWTLATVFQQNFISEEITHSFFALGQKSLQVFAGRQIGLRRRLDVVVVGEFVGGQETLVANWHLYKIKINYANFSEITWKKLSYTACGTKDANLFAGVALAHDGFVEGESVVRVSNIVNFLHLNQYSSTYATK